MINVTSVARRGNLLALVTPINTTYGFVGGQTYAQSVRRVYNDRILPDNMKKVYHETN
jgi:hypothetical protein